MIGDGLSLLKHSQNPETRGTGREVFEGVSADQVSDRENLVVRCFANFREHIKTGHNEQIRPSRVAWRQQQCEDQRENGINLYRSKEPQVGCTTLNA